MMPLGDLPACLTSANLSGIRAAGTGPNGQRHKPDWLEEPGKDIAGPETFVLGNRLVEALILGEKYGGEKYGRIERRFSETGVVARVSGSLHSALAEASPTGEARAIRAGGRAIRDKTGCLQNMWSFADMIPSERRRITALLIPSEMAQADRLTIAGGMPGIVLMENAGRAVARTAAGLVPPGARIMILCGPGNNGGDGLIAARCLHESGHDVDVRLLKPADSLKGDALEAFRRLPLPVNAAVVGEEVAGDLPGSLIRADLIVDALFGAGLDRPLEGAVADLVSVVNACGSPVLAVDLPSGVSGADGAVLGGAVLGGPVLGGPVPGEAVKAVASVTFFREKPGHLLYPGRGLCGKITVADIGIKAEVLEEIGPRTFVNAPDLWLDVWPRADPCGHKYARGHALIFGGPVSATGAARLSAGGALRAGAGLVTLASPPDALLVNACHLTAVMLKKVSGVGAIAELLADRRLNAVLIGPGYGVGGNCRAAVAAILAAGRATVLDADALTSFADDPRELFALVAGNPGDTILTPHEGEFARLFPDISGVRLAQAVAAAKRSGAIVVLKGADTVIASPDGRAAINRNAPAWLATAGSGDVLAGIAAGLLAQGVPGFEAACQAVWLHGEAGREAGPGLTAEDLAGALKPAIRRLVEHAGPA